MTALTYRTAAGPISKEQQGAQRLSILARMVSHTPELRRAYDTLLGSLRVNAAFNTGKTVLVTSAHPLEGKTTVASCLAVTAALAGYSVLLVDGNLRQPWLAPAAGIPDAPGLGEVLGGVVGAAEAIHPLDVFLDSQKAGLISGMTAGTRPPSFLPAVDWSKARTRFHDISKPFGIVLFDSPPILAASDALLLAGLADGVLLVVGAGSAQRDELRRAKEQLSQTGTPVIGAVLNQFGP